MADTLDYNLRSRKGTTSSRDAGVKAEGVDKGLASRLKTEEITKVPRKRSGGDKEKRPSGENEAEQTPSDQVLESSGSDETWIPSNSDIGSDSTDGLHSTSGLSENEVPICKADTVKPVTRDQHPDTSMYIKLFLLITVLLIVTLVAVTPWFIWPSTTTILSTEQIPKSRISIDNFMKRFQELQQSFPSQTTRFWKVILSRSKRHLSSMPPKRPLVFMIATDSQTARTSQCLAHHLGRALGSPKPQLLNGSTFQGEDGDRTKLKLDKTLKKYFDNTLAGTAIIDHIELLPPLSPFLFYSYCDNDHAVYPYATIIFVTHMQIDMSSLDHIGAETAVEQFLGTDVWGRNPPYDPGAVAALLSRITDTVLIPKMESIDVC